jgi:Zn-dependent peptidase ImmA (M78 family)
LDAQQWLTRNSTRTSPITPKARDYDPFAHAEALGIEVIYRPLTTANELWLPDHHTLVIKEGMRQVHRRNACAHGVAHAALAHRDSRPKHEIQADRYASENLIDYDELVELMKWTPDSARLANELGVTTRLLRVFLNVHRLAG